MPSSSFSPFCRRRRRRPTSWANVPDHQELNRQIAVLEYGDPSGRLLNFLGEVNGLTVFSWYHVVAIKEGAEKNIERDKLREMFEKEDMTKVPACSRRILEMKRELCIIGRGMDSGSRWVLECAQMSLEAVRVWNEVGLRLLRLQNGEKLEDGMELAGSLEKCGRRDNVRALPLDPPACRHIGIAVRSMEEALPVVREFIAYSRRIVTALHGAPE